MKKAGSRRKDGVAAAKGSFVEALEGRRLLAIHVVSSLLDTGSGSLRSALTAAASNDTIDATGLSGTITLSTPLAPASGLTGLRLLGPGKANLTIDGSDTSRAFTLQNVGLEIADLTIQGASVARAQGGAIQLTGTSSATVGVYLTLNRVDVINSKAAQYGGAIMVERSRLTIADSGFAGNVIENNSAGGSVYSWAYGGAVYAKSSLVNISGSTFEGNRAEALARPDVTFAYGLGGAIYAYRGETTISKSTFNGNSAESLGVMDDDEAPIYAVGAIHLTGTGTLSDLTIAGNSASVTVYGEDTVPVAGTVGGVSLGEYEIERPSITNSILAQNAGENMNPDLYLRTGGATLNDSFVSSLSAATQLELDSPSLGNVFGLPGMEWNAHLEPLADNGGPTRTMTPGITSPAIRTATTDTYRIDQRGYRAVDAADYGAFEVGALSIPSGPVVPEFRTTPKFDLEPGATTGQLRAAATVSEGEVTYQWKRISKPANASDPILATPDARRTEAQFFKVGTYEYRLTATSEDGESISKKILVTIDAVAKHVHIVQHGDTFRLSSSMRFKANVFDQFDGRMSPPPKTSWSLLEGEGRITSTGLYTPASGVSYSRIRVRAASGGIEGMAVNYIRTA